VATVVTLALIAAGLAYLYEGQVNTTNTLSQTNHTQTTQISALAPYVVAQAAFQHWNAISIRTVPTSSYLANATLSWVGGPLAGSYSGPSAIGQVWSRFGDQWTSIAFSSSTPSVAMSVSGQGATVSATLTFLVSPASEPQVEQELVVASNLTFQSSGGNWLIQEEGWALRSSQVVNGPQAAVESQAYLHWGAVAIENLSLVTADYSSLGVLQWEGGPLNGTYSGIPAIQGVWTRFFTLWGAVWFYAETPATISVAPNNSFAVASAPI
jgi:hypothetical protein